MELVLDREYKRTDIQDFYGGQRQGGISTPSFSDVILIFTGPMGQSYGYHDGYDDSGLFHYTGEGQIGDMSFIKGNKAIRDHETNNKTLHLFATTKRAHVKYVGEFSCVDYEIFRSTDKNGTPRDAIRFILENKKNLPSKQSTSHAVHKASLKPPNATERRGLVTSRVGQGYYRQLLVSKFQNVCAVTGSGPKEILIASHIVPWSCATDSERLDADNGILLSPVFDALFDRHLISFEDSGAILISALLKQGERAAFGITGAETISVDAGMLPYLQRHRIQLRT